MLFSSILPWTIVFHIQQHTVENGVYSIIKKNISQSIQEDLHDLCSVSNSYILKNVTLLDGELFLKNWLMKLYFYADNYSEDYIYENRFDFPLRKSKNVMITVRSSEMKKNKQLNLRLCDSDSRLLLFKLEVTHYTKTRVKRSDRVTNNLQQTWSSDMYEQKFTNERGLEITVKVPRGFRTNSSNHHRHAHKSMSRDEEADKIETLTETELVNSTTTTSTTAATTTTTSTTPYPLSEACQQYQITFESVVNWCYDQLEKLKKGEINRSACLE